jgi:hypothetical protein
MIANVLCSTNRLFRHAFGNLQDGKNQNNVLESIH